MTENKGSLNGSILRAYDIRGLVGDTLGPEDAFAIGRAFVTIASHRLGRNPRLSVAYDGRVSSPALESELVRGMLCSGADVVRVGLGPTPMLYFSITALDRDGGIMVTGSHNPPNFNGFKLVLGGMPFWDEDIQYLGRVIADGTYAEGNGGLTECRVENEYVARVCQEYRSSSGLSVAWDPGNGAAGSILRKLVTCLPGKHIVLNGEIDGTFPSHHPDPTVAENLQELIAAVQEHSCDLGIAFDGDGDRIGVVDDKGEIIWGDQLLTLYALDLLRETPGVPIIADVKTSLVFFEQVAAHGGNPVMWRTGHSPIKSKMSELNAPLAGEMSGHIFFADRYYGYDDAIYAAVRLLDLLVRSKQTLSELSSKLPRTYNTPELRFPCDDDMKFKVVETVSRRLQNVTGVEVSLIDGVRVTTSDGWWLLRASNTQPVIVARCEARCEDRLDRLKVAVREEMRRCGIEVPNF